MLYAEQWCILLLEGRRHTRDGWLAGVEKATALVIALDFVRDDLSKLCRCLVQEKSDDERREHSVQLSKLYIGYYEKLKEAELKIAAQRATSRDPLNVYL